MICRRAGAPLLMAMHVALAGCALPAWRFDPQDVTPTVLVPASAAGVQDLRGHYRALFCQRLTAPPPAKCDDTLLRLAHEPPPPAAAMPPSDAAVQRYRYVFVPGLFAECLKDLALPFADVLPGLRDAGLTADYLPVEGRGSVAHNAQQIAAAIRSSTDPRPVIVLAYSKGLVDALAFMAVDPDAASRVAAVISIAGAAGGSPLADRLLDTYLALGGAQLPLRNCAPGTGDEVRDVWRDVRAAWWHAHARDARVPIFALVAAPRPEHVSPALRTMYRLNADVDVRNDGMLLWQDQIPPWSRLLGYADADHFAIAVTAASSPSLAPLFHDQVPRLALVRAAIDVAVQSLSSPQ